MLERQEQEDAEEEIKLQNTNPFYNYTSNAVNDQQQQQNSNNYLPPKPLTHHQSTLSSSPSSTLGTSPYHNNSMQQHYHHHHHLQNAPFNKYTTERTSYEQQQQQLQLQQQQQQQQLQQQQLHASGIPILHTPPLSSQSYLINNLNNKNNEIIDGGGEGMASGYGMSGGSGKIQNIYNNYGYERADAMLLSTGREEAIPDCVIDGGDLIKDDQGRIFLLFLSSYQNFPYSIFFMIVIASQRFKIKFEKNCSFIAIYFVSL